MPNRIKMLCPKVACWPILGRKLAILATFLYMDFKFVLPLISIDIKGQTKLKVDWIQKKHINVLISKSHFAQAAFTKKPTPPTFFHETFCYLQNRCKYGFR